MKFYEEIWQLVKEYMIDYEPYILIEEVNIPRSLIVGYNLYPIDRKTKAERDFKKVSKYQSLLLDYKTEEEAEEADKNDEGLTALYIREKNIFLIDFNIDTNKYLPLYLHQYDGSSPMAFAVGNIVDNESNHRGIRENKLIELCYGKYRKQFIKSMKQKPIQEDSVEDIFNSLINSFK